MKPAIKPTIARPIRIAKKAALALALALLMVSPAPARGAPTAPDWEETIFLGQAVPLRPGGVPLAGDLPGATLFYVNAAGELLPLDELGRYRPACDEDITLVAVPSGGQSGPRQEFTYQVRVIPGTVRVLAPCESSAPGSTALFRLQGQGLTLYRQATLEADPQGGAPRLETDFSGLPYGVYQVTLMSTGEELTARLGVCETDDTIHTARSSAVLRFGPVPVSSGTVAQPCPLWVAP